MSSPLKCALLLPRHTSVPTPRCDIARSPSRHSAPLLGRKRYRVSTSKSTKFGLHERPYRRYKLTRITGKWSLTTCTHRYHQRIWVFNTASAAHRSGTGRALSPTYMYRLYLTLIVTLTITRPMRYGQPVSKRAISRNSPRWLFYTLAYTNTNPNPYPVANPGYSSVSLSNLHLQKLQVRQSDCE